MNDINKETVWVDSNIKKLVFIDRKLAKVSKDIRDMRRGYSLSKWEPGIRECERNATTVEFDPVVYDELKKERNKLLKKEKILKLRIKYKRNIKDFIVNVYYYFLSFLYIKRCD